MKAKKTTGTTAARPKFDRSKLSAGFMSNAKKAKDEASGWALDFDNPVQQEKLENSNIQKAIE